MQQISNRMVCISCKFAKWLKKRSDYCFDHKWSIFGSSYHLLGGILYMFRISSLRRFEWYPFFINEPNHKKSPDAALTKSWWFQNVWRQDSFVTFKIHLDNLHRVPKKWRASFHYFSNWYLLDDAIFRISQSETSIWKFSCNQDFLILISLHYKVFLIDMILDIQLEQIHPCINPILLTKNVLIKCGNECGTECGIKFLV